MSQAGEMIMEAERNLLKVLVLLQRDFFDIDDKKRDKNIKELEYYFSKKHVVFIGPDPKFIELRSELSEQIDKVTTFNIQREENDMNRCRVTTDNGESYVGFVPNLAVRSFF